MAFHHDETVLSTRPRLADLALAPLRALMRGFLWLGENSAHAKRLRAISMMTDGQLAARGLTRDQAIAAVFNRTI